MNTGNTETVEMTDVAMDSGRQDGKNEGHVLTQLMVGHLIRTAPGG